MSDNNPLKKALDKSKAFLALGKTRSSKDQSNADNDDHVAAAHTSYDRRQRTLSGDELRNQLDLGEKGWNEKEWAKIKQNREQKEQRRSNGPFATPSRENDNMHSGSPSNSQSNYPTPQQGAISPQRGTPQQRATPNNGSANQRSGGSREHFNRPLAFRTAQYQGSQSSPSRSAPSQRTSPLSSPPRQSEAENERISTPNRSQDNPFRTRVAGPIPNVDLRRNGRYDRHGVRVSSAEREREAYLTSQGFGVTGERIQQGNEGVTSPVTPMSGGSRYGDGVKKASGPTLF